MALLRAVNDSQSLEWKLNVGSNGMFTVHVLVKYEIVRRKCASCIEDQAFALFASVLMDKSLTGPEEGIQVLVELTPAALAKQQERLLMSAYQSLMRKTTEVPETIRILKNANKAVLQPGVPTTSPLDPELLLELEKFDLLLVSYVPDHV
jgi:hypothetical protein